MSRSLRLPPLSAEINHLGELVMESRLITVSNIELDAEAAVNVEFPQS